MEDPYDRELAAWNRLTSTIGAGAAIGTLAGGLTGGAVGCVLGGIAGATVASAAIIGLFVASVETLHRAGHDSILDQRVGSETFAEPLAVLGVRDAEEMVECSKNRPFGFDGREQIVGPTGHVHPFLGVEVRRNTQGSSGFRRAVGAQERIDRPVRDGAHLGDGDLAGAQP